MECQLNATAKVGNDIANRVLRLFRLNMDKEEQEQAGGWWELHAKFLKELDVPFILPPLYLLPTQENGQTMSQ